VILVPSLSTLALGIIALYISTKFRDDVEQLAIALPALFCLFLSIVFAPWLIKLPIAIALLVSKQHTNSLIRAHFSESQEIACPFATAPRGVVERALHTLNRVHKRKMTRTSMPLCCHALQKSRSPGSLPSTSTPVLLGQPCHLTPKLVCAPLIQVSHK
jgi:hypothetical protein